MSGPARSLRWQRLAWHDWDIDSVAGVNWPLRTFNAVAGVYGSAWSLNRMTWSAWSRFDAPWRSDIFIAGHVVKNGPVGERDVNEWHLVCFLCFGLVFTTGGKILKLSPSSPGSRKGRARVEAHPAPLKSLGLIPHAHFLSCQPASTLHKHVKDPKPVGWVWEIL